MRLFVVLSALLGLSAQFAHGQTNLILNGDFSSGPALTNGAATLGTPGQTNITSVTDWSINIGSANAGGGNNASAYYVKTGQTGDYWVPWAANAPHPVNNLTTPSTYSIQLDSASETNPNGEDSISQTVANLANGTYRLNFSMAAESSMVNDSFHPLTTRLDVIVTGLTTYVDTAANNPPGVTFTNTQSGYGIAQNSVVWSNYSISFTVTGGTQNVTITFQDNAIDIANNPSLANVSLVSLVPEFSHWAAFAGFGLVCALVEIRRRRRAF